MTPSLCMQISVSESEDKWAEIIYNIGCIIFRCVEIFTQNAHNLIIGVLNIA
jgi:hypothetical protein